MTSVGTLFRESRLFATTSSPSVPIRLCLVARKVLLCRSGEKSPLPLPSNHCFDEFYFRENALEQIEKLNKYIATRTCIVRNQFTVADIAMWAAIKSRLYSLIFFFLS